MRKIVSILAMALVFAGCDLLGNESNESELAVKFEVVRGTSSSSLRAGHAALAAEGAPVTVQGTNGVLTLTDIRLVVAKFKLEREEDSCDHSGEDDDERDDDRGCGNFRAAPSFISLPLDAGAVTVATSEIPEGSYEEFEFKVKNLDLDDDDEGDDDNEHAAIAALSDSIHAAFPNWPGKASVVFVGTFTPNGGQPQSFTTFAKGEIEVEMDLDPALVITPDGASRELTVVVDPALWLKLADGTVLDLSAYDFAKEGELLEFEVELENGFTEIEVEESDDDGDEDDDEDEDED